MKCSECGGELDKTREISVEVGPSGIPHGGGRSSHPALPCENCGLLHWKDSGEKVFSSEGSAYLECGKVVYKKPSK